jgi:uncharacterized protein YbaR (Trm112 family)
VPWWIVICPKCRQQFLYAEIDQTTIEEANRDPYRVWRRPPAEKRTCPHCKTESLFTTNDLLYRS